MPVPDVTIEQAQRLGLDVLNWRYEELERAGYPVEVAIALAERGDVDERADVIVAGGIASRHRSGMAGNSFDLKWSVAHQAFFTFTRNPLNSGV